MTKNAETTTFAFRTKFGELINDENRSIITAAFERFCKLAPNTACYRLWRLTYVEETEVLDEVLEKFGLDSEIIPLENILLLRNELRIQYEKLHPKFLDVNAPGEKVMYAFAKLYNKTDGITAKVVYDRCLTRLYSVEATTTIEGTLDLLCDDKNDKRNFGGIRSLDFNKKEAAYLKPFHMEIHALLKEMHEYNQSQLPPKNKPLAKLDTLVKEAGMELPVSVEVESTEVSVETSAQESFETENEVQAEIPEKEPEQTVSGFICLTPEEILSKKDVFISFMENYDLNKLVEIGKLGFDLNEVMAKKELIETFLNAVKALSE